MKKKLLIFHPALAPYRVDTFNFLNKAFDLHVVFLYENLWNHTFDQWRLQKQVAFSHSFLLKGFDYKGRVFRFGMLKTIKEFKPDVIFGYEFSFTTLHLVLLKKLGFFKQKIATLTDDSLGMCEEIGTLRTLSRDWILPNLDYVVVLSKTVAEFYQQMLKVEATKLLVSPILQDPKRLRQRSPELVAFAHSYSLRWNLKGRKVLLFIGRFIKEKGIGNLIEILAPILKANRDTVLVLVGDGCERPQIEEMVRARGLVDSVFMPGRFEGEELLAWYLCASGFVLPSFKEAFGAVVNEALIFGLPVICSAHVGSLELLEPEYYNDHYVFDPNHILESRTKFREFLATLAPICIDSLRLIRPSRMKQSLDVIINDWKEKIDA